MRSLSKVGGTGLKCFFFFLPWVCRFLVMRIIVIVIVIVSPDHVFTATPLMFSEMFRITSSPESHTVVVESVNSSRISLVWTYTLAVNESIRTFTFFRRIPGDREDTRVAIKRGNRRFVYSSEEFRAKYEATSSSNSQSATLVLLDVTNSEEYTYTMRLITNFESRRFSTTIVVYSEYQTDHRRHVDYHRRRQRTHCQHHHRHHLHHRYPSPLLLSS